MIGLLNRFYKKEKKNSFTVKKTMTNATFKRHIETALSTYLALEKDIKENERFILIQVLEALEKDLTWDY